mmetsp:Transcript_19393/g.18741  ORF Transcript_19393/g.18741 Transcript_19393/m.18741 type:complete len:203 (-) Transcript_19393:1144-1752(-)|eukprot:CAMPEP_0119039666 /NCGR_PEP_ID=MMETSP1177-20130426/9291_1 /TAXON_ID=2985 /ORGANISM="Ochromonas sp, Strain CCMP1899" /LENGTH=202 /DNA_ID=CAMNT_0007003845 /DNA_START=180 /DNA_END=788 /DNA_ORIENTATION=-
MNAPTGKPREVKAVLLGDTGVGKSSLVLRFVTNNFKPYSESTIGASFMSKTISVNGKNIKYQIWDTAGQEKYHSLAPMYYRGAACAIIVYDISRASTFKTLKTWVDELKNQGPKDIAIAIAGNKADLEDSREVDKNMAAAYAEEIGAFYLETSAKDDLNVQDIFVQISNRLPAAPQVDSSIIRESSRLRSQQQAQQAKKGCC